MSTSTRDGLMLAVALISTAGCGYDFVKAVLNEDRLLSRAGRSRSSSSAWYRPC